MQRKLTRGRRRFQPRRAPVADATTVLSLFILLLVAVPSRLVLAGIGSAGGPATLVGLAAALWWCWFQLQRTAPADAGRQPVRIAVLVFLASGLASYAAAMLRATPVAEVSTADSGMLRLIAWTGIALVANDGITDSRRLEVFLRRLVFAGGLVAVLGLLQFFTKTTLVDELTLPGLSSTQDFAGVQIRGSFTRSVGTAIHPLEYSAVLTMVLPLALTQGLAQKGSLIARWWPAAAIAAATALAVSRSTMLCLAVGVAVMVPTWSSTIRRWMLAAVTVGVTAIFMLVPGMLGVVASLFGGISGDSSALSRTDGFALAAEFIERSPLVGRGFATFLPDYRILDNQFLLTLIEMGAVGLVALVGIILAAFACAEAARRAMPERRAWAQALTAAMAAGAAGLVFFDGFAFPQAAGMFFVVAGTCGAAWRVARAERAGQTMTPHSSDTTSTTAR
jgi:O-antigen ligase